MLEGEQLSSTREGRRGFMGTRRDFLKTTLSGATLLLAACGQTTTSAPAAPSAPSSTPAPPKPTVAPVASAPAVKAPTSSPVAGNLDVAKPTALRAATLEQELALPASVLEAAQKEGKLNWISSIDKEPAQAVMDGFRKRYPFIEVRHQEGSEEVRTVRTLTEFKAGRVTNDVIMSISSSMTGYKSAGALTPLNDLPAYANYEAPYRDTEHGWAGFRTQFWGIGVNTDAVKPHEVPSTWEALTDPKWKGRMGLGDRPTVWVQHLWKNWGPERTTNFLKRLFANDPQRRKEGLAASANLLAAGEFDLYIPSAPYRIEGLVAKGSSVSWSSPDPLTIGISDLSILQKSPNPNAAKLFANWLLSREGQAVYSKADNAAPTHPLLRADPEYLGMFAKSIVGRPMVALSPDDEEKILPLVNAVWQPLWIG